MPDLTPSFDVSLLERELLHIRSVTAARIVCTHLGVIDEIHVVGTPTRNPKQVVRDVETLLLVQHQMRIDHRKVSLVQVDDHRASAFLPRILLLAVNSTSGGEAASATVTLELRDTQVIGLSSAPIGQLPTSEYLIGYATTHALDQLITPHGHTRLEQLERQPFGTLEICLVHLSLLVEDSLESLVGVSIVTGDTHAASARAVLDAVNRRLPRLLHV